MAPPTLSIQTLSVIRLLFGTSCMVIPALTSEMFRLTPVTGATVLLIRLVGARELIMGTFLWTADTSTSRRQSLLISLVADSVDILSTGVGVLEGNLELYPAALAAGAALVGVGLGLLGWRGLGGLEGKEKI